MDCDAVLLSSIGNEVDMSKATLIEFWRDLLLSDDALEQYKSQRADAVGRYDLTDDERRNLLEDDFAAIYRRGVPRELLFQGILLAGHHPREYMRRLQEGLKYAGRGTIAIDASSTDRGSWT
jgi:hypothetical protein